VESKSGSDGKRKKARLANVRKFYAQGKPLKEVVIEACRLERELDKQRSGHKK
jgi:hypothetical protein